MATRQEITTLISYVLGDNNRQILVAQGLEALPTETRMSAMRGLQDLGWIGHSGTADFEESYSLTKDGRMIYCEQPALEHLDSCARSHVESLRAVDGETNCAQKEALRKLISTECDLGNWDSVLINSFQLKKLAESSRDVGILGYSLYYIGKAEMAQNRWGEALESLLNSNERFIEAGDTRGVALSSGAMGIIYAHKADYASAIRCFESGLSMAKNIGDKKLEASAEGNLANVYDLEGKYSEAQKAYARCLELFTELNDLVGEARTANNLGVLHMMEEDYGSAADYFDKTVESCRRIKNKEVLGLGLVNGGYSHIRCGSLGKAIAYTDEAAALFREQNDMNLLALAYRNYGSIEMRSSKFESAFEWFEKSLRAAKASEVQDTIAACSYEYGISLMDAATDFRLAKKLLKKSASIFKGMGNFEKANTIEKKIAAA